MNEAKQGRESINMRKEPGHCLLEWETQRKAVLGQPATLALSTEVMTHKMEIGLC